MARHPIRRTRFAAWSLAAGSLLLAGQMGTVRGADAAEHWPASWRETYEHFQNFIGLRDQIWPASRLEVSEEGSVTSGNPLSVHDDDSIVIFRDGQVRLNRSVTGTHLSKIFRPADYCACVRVSTPLGYQFLPPLLHVRGIEDDTGMVRWLSTPAPEGDGRWPNWRGLLFGDFHIMPARRNPSIIHEENARVSPSVKLQVDRDAVLRRPLFEDVSFEEPLHWRVYRDGELREGGKASGEGRYACNFGPGVYLAFLAVVGEEGFMPVSNLVPFYVHEGVGDEKPSLLPTDTDGDSVPDYLELRYGFDPEDPRDAEADADGDGLRNGVEMKWSVGQGNFIDLSRLPPWLFVGDGDE